MTDETNTDAPVDAQTGVETPTEAASTTETPTAAPSAETAAPETPVTAEQPELTPVEKARAEFDLPSAWTDKHVELWLGTVDFTKPVRNEDNVFLFDPTRAVKQLNAWTTKELLAFLRGELLGVQNSKADAIVKEYRTREELASGWSTQDVLAFYREGVKPETTPSGVLLKDATRATRKVGDWTTEELVAWGKGEITNAGANTDVLIAKEAHVRLKLDGYDDSVEAVRKRIVAKVDAVATVVSVTAPVSTSGTSTIEYKAVGALTVMNVSFIDETLQRYADTVAPGKPLTDTTGGRAQRELENLFQYVLKQNEPKVIAEMLDRIKAFVKIHRAGVFGPSMAYRFVHELKGDRKAQSNHVNFIELFVIITDSNKARRQQADIRALLAGAPANKQDILIDYFTKTT